MQKPSGIQELEHIFTRGFPHKVNRLLNALEHLRQTRDTGQLSDIVGQLSKIDILAESLHLTEIQLQCKTILKTLGRLQDRSIPLSEESLTLLQAQTEQLKHSKALSHLPMHFNKEALESLQYHTKVLLAIPDKALQKDICEQFEPFGYTCLEVQNFEALYDRLNKEQHLVVFAALIMDMDFCKDKDLSLFKNLPAHLPLLFLSNEDALKDKLFAARAGASGFFKKPVEFTNLLEKIDDLIIPVHENAPYRVLMVEDSKTQAVIIKRILEQAGMIVESVQDPDELNELLQIFQPELILMDIYMPKCNGIELAALIRQEPSYVGIPIVFLSSEKNLTKQMDAMRLGGDDFLTKPVEDDHLIAAISNRIDRARAIRATMIQDGLTGLLNHTPILEQLNIEIARSEREKSALTVVMIDIDHFKNINDTYGHPVGDTVLKSLARLFKQRFRKSDSVGRYGGEEFLAVMPNSKAETLKPLLDNIREAFSQISFQSEEGKEFKVTFSAGMSTLSPSLTTATQLVQAADKALYKAKHEGRNQVCIAS